MKNALIVVLMMISSLSCKKTFYPITGSWVAVESRHYDEDSWISSMNGVIFNFTSDSMSFRHVFFDSTRSMKVIYLEDNLFELKQSSMAYDTIRIHQMSKDSITFLIDDKMLVKLIPVVKGNHAQLNIDSIINNNWEIHNNGIISSIKVTNKKWEDLDKITPLLSIVDNRIEKFSLSKFQNSQFITVTVGQTDLNLYQILNIESDTIFTKILIDNEYRYPQFIKKKKISQSEIRNIENDLFGRWHIAELIGDNSKLAKGDSSDISVLYYGFKEPKRFKHQSLVDKSISYAFTKNTFQSFENDKLMFQGGYKISNDGEYIILNNGLDPNDYISIIELNDSSLIFEKQDEFSITSSGKYIEYPYKVRLEKTITIP